MKMRTPTPLAALVAAFVLTASGTAGAQSAAADEPPRTSGGRPDLQGVWHFNTTTPLQRPERLADRTHYTEEEHAALAARTAAFRPWDQPPPDGSVGSYNQFWWDHGGPVADRRSSSTRPTVACPR